MKVRSKILSKQRTILLGLLTVAVLGTAITIANIVRPSNSQAVSYQDPVELQFSLNPTISIDLSSNNLTINNLAPGSSSDSNIITINVSTNAGYGYYLAATAGTSTTNTNLTHSGNSSYKFTNLASNKASLSNFDANYWGYSYSTNNGTSWISGSQGSTTTGYNGLPQDGNNHGATGVRLIDTTNPVDGKSVRFKIGAKAGSTQAQGTYTGQVNFYAVSRTSP